MRLLREKLPEPSSQQKQTMFKWGAGITAFIGGILFLYQFMPLIVAAARPCPDESQKDCENGYNPFTYSNIAQGDTKPNDHFIWFFVVLNVCWLCCCGIACAMGYGARKESQSRYSGIDLDSDDEFRRVTSDDEDQKESNKQNEETPLLMNKDQGADKKSSNNDRDDQNDSKIQQEIKTETKNSPPKQGLFQPEKEAYKPSSQYYQLFTVTKGQEQKFENALQQLATENKFENLNLNEHEEQIKQIISDALGETFDFAKKLLVVAPKN